MKLSRNKIYLVSILYLGAALLMWTQGCVTFEANAGKSLATVATTVDAAMKGWASWVVAGKTTPDQEAKVKFAYGQYQISMDIAKNAYLTSVASTDKSVFETANLVLQQNKQNLLNLIQTFQGIKN